MSEKSRTEQERNASREQELHAFRDGELSGWRHWRAARRLARDPRARRELAGLDELGALLREHAASVAEPDFWEGIRARLPYAERPAPLASHEAVRRAPAPRAPAWLGAVLATAVVALVVATGYVSGEAPSVASVRWLDGKGKPVMVLRDDVEATIIWVIQKPKQQTQGAGDAVV
jgi:anti-sigma factor RsiW